MEKLQLFSLNDIENKTVSGILTRVIDDIENIQQTIILTLQLLTHAPFIVIVTIEPSEKANFLLEGTVV